MGLSAWVSCRKGHINLRSTVAGAGGKCPQCGGAVRAVTAPRFGPDQFSVARTVRKLKTVSWD